MPEELEKTAPQPGEPTNNEQETHSEETETAQSEDLEGGNSTDKKPGDGDSKTGNGKKEETKSEEGEEKKDEKTEVEEYGEFTMPDGVKVAEKEMAEFKEVAKKHGLSQEAAQELVNIHAGMVKKQMQEFEQFQQDLKDQCVEKFGTKLDAMRADAAKALDKFGGDDLRKVLEDFGMGNHPVLLAAFAKIGREVSEDTAVLAGNKKTGDVTFAEALYGK